MQMNAEIQQMLQSGRHAEAERRLREICAGPAADAESWFFLGALAGMRGDAAGAESGFRQALALMPEFLQARFNLGFALRDQGRLEEARAELETVVARQPRHAEAWNALGCLHVTLERHDAAERCFRSALDGNPGSVDALTNLGNVLTVRQQWAEAIKYYQRALELAPAHGDAAANLGSALVALGRCEEAIGILRRAAMANPANIEMKVRLGAALNRCGNPQEVEQVFREVLRVSPGHCEAQYFLAALGVGDCPRTAPPEYVAQLFDGYAETFDSELVGKLHYQAPQALLGAVQAALGERCNLTVLDIGCGTGLCGALFRPLARTLVGVDLAPKMVAKARARAVYDEIEVGDLTEALGKYDSALDVVLAADVFIYVGALERVFEAVARALRPAGLLAFSVETLGAEEVSGYSLRRSGRYAHSQAYVAQLAQRFGLEAVSVEAIDLRLEEGQPIPGAIHVLRRMAGVQPDDVPDKGVAGDVAARTPEATQAIAKQNYDAFLAAIPAEIQRREEKLPAELRLMNAKPMVKLARIRKSVETLFAYAEGHVACQKGCAYCCHQAIDISRLEAEYIQQNTGIQPVRVTNPPQRDVRSFSEETPCPFLKQGVCSIYAYRPLICRLAMNLDSDPYWCEFDNWHKPGGAVPRPTFRSIYDAYRELNEKAGSVMADIRDFFPVVPD